MTALKWVAILIVSTVLANPEPQSHYNVFLQHFPASRRSAYYDQNVFLGQPKPQLVPDPFGTSFAQFPNTFLGQPAPIPQPSLVPGQPQGCAVAPAACNPTRYRTLDGSCNNLAQPTWGVPNSTYTRLLPANYGDGISNPTRARSGNDLPGSRTVSLVIYPDAPVEDPKWTLNAMQYGQIITHDMSMIAGSTQAQPHSTRCCTDNGQLLELANIPEHCFPIRLPQDDPAHSQINARCMNFVRTITDRDRNCPGVSQSQAAEQLTAVNHFLDLSIVYGNDDQTNRGLRQFQGGRLRVDVRNGRQWPPRSNNASGVCSIQSPDEACYQTGDTRANQNPQLTLLQVVLLREHNRIADTLAQLNPQWDDETIFQEARRIAIAEHEQISYYEWLPIFIGVENALKNKIIYQTAGHVNDYNPNVNPTVLNEHATAAFRFFHSLIAGYLDLVTEQRSSYGNLRLSDWFNRPAILEQGNNFDELSRGLSTQPELASDRYHDPEITQFLFRGQRAFGQDLKAFDIQRNRDHGLASYNEYRAFCGLPRARTFEDLLDVIPAPDVKKLATLYEDVNDVDLTVGGSLESLVPGTLAGPTFLCILTEQFYRTRAGDRYWFENGGENGFTPAQLREIRKATISRLLCDNSHNVAAMQPRGFERISADNVVVPCSNLPVVDLRLWQDQNSKPIQNDYFAFPDNNDYFFK